MKKTINKKVYNTDTAELIDVKIFGEWGDTDGYEERLYQTKRGEYFVYGIGGKDSPYPAESITLVTAKEAASFKKEKALL